MSEKVICDSLSVTINSERTAFIQHKVHRFKLGGHIGCTGCGVLLKDTSAALQSIHISNQKKKEKIHLSELLKKKSKAS